MRRVPSPAKAAAAITLAWLALPAQAAQDINGNPITVVGQDVPVDVPSTYYTQLHPCPKACSTLSSSKDWTVYSAVERLQFCDQPMLVDLAVFNPLDDPTTGVLIKACTVGDANSTNNPLVSNSTKPVTTAPAKLLGRDNDTLSGCMQIGTESHTTLDLVRSGSSATDASGDLLALLGAMQDSFQNSDFCDRSILFGYVNGKSVGLYLSNMFGKATIVSTLEEVAAEIKDNGVATSIAAQLCSSGSGFNTTTQGGIFGISIDTTGIKSLATVQEDIMAWAQGECLDRSATGTLPGVSVWANTGSISSNTTFNSTFRIRGQVNHQLQRRGDCTTAVVYSGDSCGSMATKCGISASDFTKYNPATNFCSTLQPNQKVCCSAGTIPTPQKYSNGTCFTYNVQSGDTCSAIALSNGLTTDQLQDFNKGKTWAWTNCTDIHFGINICLSDGTAPLPAPYDNAVCGPVKPGTTYPTDGTNITDLNPCPLNACCNIWGQCGITPDFCTEYESPNGNPGYSPTGKNGCISNCGQEITNKDSAPSFYGRVGYWESWNMDRPCLNLEVRHSNTDGSYSIMHWAFATIDSSFQPQINDTYKQWDDFTNLSGVRKVVSFGGWGYSTSPATYDMLREAMADANRATFVKNLVSFVNDNNLDGIDIDWEYPGAPDIPGIPAGQATDGIQYLKFLSTLHASMPSGKTVSIAAPASFWYLKQFPIKQMATVVDYIVYMTYDLHGQWDYANIYSIDGCPAGNCLRSHVNLTETVQSLAMITKAGVPTNKIFVGESSYGRSFGMSDPSCTGAMCTFTGAYDASTAEPGMCTGTAGYISNAEIYNIVDQGTDNATMWYDTDSNSDIATWGSNWVAFMSQATRDSRRGFWEGFNFQGTIDWAVDLQNFADEGANGDDDDGEDWLPPGDLGWTGCSGVYSTLEDMSADENIPYWCSAQYLLTFLQQNLTASMKAYDDLMSDGYDGKFNTYSDAVVKGSSKEVKDFMMANGNKYFACMVNEEGFCCDKCAEQTDGLAGGCDYCIAGDDCCDSQVNKMRRGDGGPSSGTPGCGVLSSPKITYVKTPEPCPPDYSKRGVGQGDPSVDTVWWTLVPNKADQFYADIYEATGISQDNLSFQDINNSECTPSDSLEECQQNNWDLGIPAPKDYTKDDVLNPKDTVSKAYNNLENIKGDQFTTVIQQVTDGSYAGSPMDLVDALALPIFMISDAIDGMNSVVEVADEIDHEKMLAIIFGFLSAIFFFIPVAGEVAGAITELANIARIAELIGTLGNSAMDIYQLVDTKGNAPLAIFDLITGPLALLDIAAISKAASVRRGMSKEDEAKLGKVKDKLDKVEEVKSRGVCKVGGKKKRTVESTVLALEPAHVNLPHNAVLDRDLNGFMPYAGMGSF